MGLFRVNEIHKIQKAWQWVKLDEAVDVFDNLRKPVNSEEREKRIIGKKTEDLFPYYGATGQVGWIDEFITNGEYVLVGEDGAPFLDLYKEKAYIIRGKTWVNNHAHILQGKAGITLNAFLLNYLNHFNYNGFVNGTTRFKLTKGRLLDIPIPLPPIPEQHAIVSKIEQLFSELDKGIESLKTAQQQLKVYRQSVLKWAFEGKLTEKWRQNQNLPDALELLEKIQKEREEKAKAIGKKLKPVAPLTKEEIAVLPALPKGWGWVRLGEVSIGVEYGSAAKSKEAGKVPVLRMGNIQNGKFDWQNLVYTNDDAEIKKYLLSKNDVLFNRTNSPELVGKTAIYKDERPAIFAGYLIRINHLPSIVAADYLNYFLNSHFAKTYGNSVKTDGVNQSNINGERLKGYPFPICSLSEQHQIVQEIESRLSECDNMEATIAISLQQAEALRQSILKKAFEGKLLNEKELEAVRQDPKWEPAERLLERIRAEKDGRHSGRKVGRARHEQNEA